MATALYAAARRRCAAAWPMHATSTGIIEVAPLVGTLSHTYHAARLQRGICAWVFSRGTSITQQVPSFARASPSFIGRGQCFLALPDAVGVGGVRCLRYLAAPPAPVLTEEQIRKSANPTGALTFKARVSGGEKSRRLNAAWDACRRGEPFEMPEPEPSMFPGPCGAVMNILRDVGPCTVLKLWDLCETRYPGVVKSKVHLRDEVLQRRLVHKLMRVRANGSKFKDHWSFRKKGQIRMAIARDMNKDSVKGKRRPRNVPAYKRQRPWGVLKDRPGPLTLRDRTQRL